MKCNICKEDIKEEDIGFQVERGTFIKDDFGIVVFERTKSSIINPYAFYHEGCTK